MSSLRYCRGKRYKLPDTPQRRFLFFFLRYFLIFIFGTLTGYFSGGLLKAPTLLEKGLLCFAIYVAVKSFVEVVNTKYER